MAHRIYVFMLKLQFKSSRDGGGAMYCNHTDNGERKITHFCMYYCICWRKGAERKPNIYIIGSKDKIHKNEYFPLWLSG